MPPIRRAPRLIVFWLRGTRIILAAFVCGSLRLLAAAQCGTESVPHTPAGAAFQRGCDERAAGNYLAAIHDFQEAAQLSHALGNLHWEAKAGVYIGSTQLQLFHYGAALQTTEAAAALAKRSGDDVVLGGAEINVASIYAQLGNFALAEQKLRDSIEHLGQTPRQDLLAQAYFQLSYQLIRFGETHAGMRFSDLAIKTAQKAEKPQFEATAWDFRGTAQVLAGETTEAEKSLANAVALYRKEKMATPPTTLEHLAELKWKEGQNEAALGYIDQAFTRPDLLFQATPQYYPLTVRAGILRDLGRTDEALAAYRKAVRVANSWRRAALPGDTTNIQTVRQLNDTYQSFAEFAADQSLKTHDEPLAREAWEALAQNRAATLREQLALAMGRNQALPPEYLAKLGELQSVQARVTLAEDAKSQARLADLESEIGELETKIGLRAEKKSISAENNPDRTSLRGIQTGLGSTEALLSFCLGERESFLWAVTREAVNLYRLAAAPEIGERAKAVREALEHHQNFAGAARTLSVDLFSQLDAKYWQKPDWLIVGDGALLDRVPLAVLPDRFQNAAILIKGHTVRLLPSELMLLARAPEAQNARFVGIADPLYNLADSRRPQTPLLKTANVRGANALGRLPGSLREIRTSAHYSGMREVDLLIGSDASLSALSSALSKNPSIIHFAVHVVSPPGHPDQAALALSMGQDNIPQLLTREKIASLRVPGSLVVLSGCSSGQGQPAPSTGLIGLSRAWLLAGASAVIVSNWPTPDDSGSFFSTFYSRLSEAHNGSLAQRAASALQQAQLQMQQRGGYGSAAAFWAAYSIVSKE